MSTADRSDFGIDVRGLAAWLATVGEPVAGPLELQRIGLGQSNLTFAVSDGTHQWVARRPPVGELVASAHDVAREYRIVAALDGTSVPVPRAVGLCSDPSVCAAPIFVMERSPGQPVDTLEAVEEVPQSQRGSLTHSLVRALAHIHAVEVDAVGLGDLASRSPYALRQLKRWTRQWEAVRTRDSALVTEIAARLTDAVPPQHEVRLVHGDFHLRNVLVRPNSGEVSAVLDWELSTLGDPIADLGSMLAYWPEPGDPPQPIFGGSMLPGFLRRADLIDIYGETSGRSTEHVAFWHALGLWKIAVIGEGVMRRALDHPENAAASGTPSAADIDTVLEVAHSALPS